MQLHVWILTHFDKWKKPDSKAEYYMIPFIWILEKANKPIGTEIRSLVACGRYDGVTAEKQEGTFWGVRMFLYFDWDGCYTGLEIYHKSVTSVL